MSKPAGAHWRPEGPSIEEQKAHGGLWEGRHPLNGLKIIRRLDGSHCKKHWPCARPLDEDDGPVPWPLDYVVELDSSSFPGAVCYLDAHWARMGRDTELEYAHRWPTQEAAAQALKEVQGVVGFTPPECGGSHDLARRIEQARVVPVPKKPQETHGGLDEDDGPGLPALSVVKTSTSYRVEVPVELFRLAILSLDGTDNDLYRDLEALGVQNIDWNGHFGPNVFFSALDEDDTPELHAKVRRAIKRTIRKALRDTQEAP